MVSIDKIKKCSEIKLGRKHTFSTREKSIGRKILLDKEALEWGRFY
jgi:hypothetical protein